MKGARNAEEIKPLIDPNKFLSISNKWSFTRANPRWSFFTYTHTGWSICWFKSYLPENTQTNTISPTVRQSLIDPLMKATTRSCIVPVARTKKKKRIIQDRTRSISGKQNFNGLPFVLSSLPPNFHANRTREDPQMETAHWHQQPKNILRLLSSPRWWWTAI